MRVLLYLPAILQGLAIVVDETFFHYHRRLPRWERIGHPLDTLSVLLAYLFLLVAEPTQGTLIAFFAISVFSSLFVTKDEFVHAGNCSSGEHWLHAVLFVLHPTAFFAAGWLWWTNTCHGFLAGQSSLLGAFLVYQILYWGIFAKEQRAAG